MADDDDDSDWTEALTEPRDRLLVTAGRVRAINDFVDILADQADDVDQAGGELLQAIVEELKDLMRDAMQEQARLQRAIDKLTE